MTGSRMISVCSSLHSSTSCRVLVRDNSPMSYESASVVIVGAGILGASVAYHLSARGCRDVVVLEKAATEIAGSTARSAGGVRHREILVSGRGRECLLRLVQCHEEDLGIDPFN